uniref:Zinc finger protein 200 n=1 Tax=Loxodonta africana TaxID=9785 RepID=G3UKB6_LOXAF
MAAKVVPMPPKPKRSFILRVPPNSKLGQDLLRDATSGPKTIHQLVLEHFLTFLPKPSVVQPSQKAKETLVIMKDVSSSLQNRVSNFSLSPVSREGAQQKQELASLCSKAEPEELVVFEDLNVFHSQEECVSLDLSQQPTSENEEYDVGEMMLLVNDSNHEGDSHQEEPADNEDCRGKHSERYEMDCSLASEQSPDCHKEERLNTFIPHERKLRNLLVTVENDIPLEELSKYVDINVTALTRNRRTRRWYTCPPGNEEFVLHLQSHEAERPYDCKKCGRRFGRLSNCTRHEKTHS